MMAEIVVYSTFTCPYCARAKGLLERKGAAYKEIDVTMEPDLREEMTRKANGRRTVPQIFINGRHIGGSDDLAALERAGQLDGLLAQPAA
jgi:glutaredoxin 3